VLRAFAAAALRLLRRIRARASPAYDPLMTTPDLPAVRATLEAERDRLRSGLAEGIVAPGPMTYGSQAAAASQVFEQQRDLALRDRNVLHLERVEAAITRLADGTFGACLRCGRPIAPERLEALPWAAYCIECQRVVRRAG
jgi:DnaK suppressor protein